jgi:hypothetical protein
MLVIDSNTALKFIESEIEPETNQIQKWIDLLEPVKFLSAHD